MQPILQLLQNDPEYVRLQAALSEGAGPLSVFGLGEAQRAHVAAVLGQGGTLLYLAGSEQIALRAAEEMEALGVPACYLPPRGEALSGELAASNESAAARVRVLAGLGRAPLCVTLSPRTLLEPLLPPARLQEATVRLAPGDVTTPQTLLARLVENGYTRAELCEGRGQAALRGGYLDVFPVTAESPVRIEFFDTEIDTMRTYDPLSQRSIENIEQAVLPPAGELAAQAQSGVGVLDYLPPDAIVFMDEPGRIEEGAKTAYEEDVSLNSPLATIKRLAAPRTLMSFALTRSYSLIAPKDVFRFETRAATEYAGGEALLEDLAVWRAQRYTVLFFAGVQATRLQDRLADQAIDLPVLDTLAREVRPGEALILRESLCRGFLYPQQRLAVLSERELFGTPRRVRQTTRKRPQLAFSELAVGDLIVHELYGIGRFEGVETLTVGAEKTARDYLLLRYAGGDKLYIPTDQLDRVQKYIGGETDGEEGGARLSKLGGGEWQKTVNRTRESVKKLAFDLAALYGERRKRKGFRFSADSAWQRRLEESFPYEETPDQLRSLAEIKTDMQSERVMDRLLCGDVGYGKTEVALRACFKAVQDSKQVAFLVPTTILAQQHYNTFCARFAGYPVKVALLSRFNTPAEAKHILSQLAEGTVDVVIGTHKLLSKQVRFRDLGLLIVDEEQRFGVGHKEQIKALKKDVDVLMLSATPIPRTLHMSMTGIRDMSVIETPPEQRYPVQTYVLEYSEAVVCEAIRKEVGRGGQCYFVYNQVRNMERFAAKLQALLPEVRFAMAHGQMPERMLEKTMLAFMEGEYDVLLCSTIIESGLDIGNVNTIIVYDADHMGLSQLYQLRGRVGRDVRLGYAFFTFRRDKVLTEVAEKRLNAIREFTQFGSGFKIAMRDLEIRGAGNLLGPEQHGHMAAVGYEMYCKLVEDAIRETRGEPVRPAIDTVMEVPLSAFIPHGYIGRETDRLFMYKRIALIAASDDLMDVQDELIDRFGEIPEPVRNLMDVALLKAAAGRAYITRLQIIPGEARLFFDPDAPMNGEKLLDVIRQTEGAQFKAGETPMLLLRRKGEDAAMLCRTLPQIVYMLGDCIDMGT